MEVLRQALEFVEDAHSLATLQVDLETSMEAPRTVIKGLEFAALRNKRAAQEVDHHCPLSPGLPGQLAAQPAPLCR